MIPVQYSKLQESIQARQDSPEMGRSKIVSSTIYCASLYITSHKVNLSLTKLPITLLQKRWTFEHVGRGKSWIFYFSCVKKPLESQKG